MYKYSEMQRNCSHRSSGATGLGSTYNVTRGGGGAECTSSAVLLDKLIVPHLFIILATVRRSQLFIFLSIPVST
jgi:hypothetical protein